MKDETIPNCKVCKSNSLLTQAKNGDELVAILQTANEEIITLADQIMKLGTEHDVLKIKLVIMMKNGW